MLIENKGLTIQKIQSLLNCFLFWIIRIFWIFWQFARAIHRRTYVCWSGQIFRILQIFRRFAQRDLIQNFRNFRNCQNLLTTQASNSHVCQIPGAAKELSSCGRCQILKELRRSCAQPLSCAEELRRRSYNVEEGRSNATGPYIIFSLLLYHKFKNFSTFKRSLSLFSGNS